MQAVNMVLLPVSHTKDKTMPNWNQNLLYLVHSDPAMIERAVQGAKDSGLFSAFLPTPTDLENPIAETYGGDTADEANRVRSENIDKHGFASWYDWRVNNWGTKWDASDCHVDRFEQEPGKFSANFHFDSAWSPPIQFYHHLTELGFEVKAYYYEPGMGCCGKYENGVDDGYEISGDSEWVVKNIPADIVEHFDIATSMREWEENEVDDENND
jgi:hypothetical protein